jgi:hypothetical protein
VLLSAVHLFEAVFIDIFNVSRTIVVVVKVPLFSGTTSHNLIVPIEVVVEGRDLQPIMVSRGLVALAFVEHARVVLAALIQQSIVRD